MKKIIYKRGTLLRLTLNISVIRKNQYFLVMQDIHEGDPVFLTKDVIYDNTIRLPGTIWWEYFVEVIPYNV
jgi:hypothetical protein